MRPAKDGFIVRFDGVADRNAAEALRNVKLYVERDRLPAAEDGEFYLADLIGLAAVTPQGEPLGEVIAVHNFGAGDIIELKLAADGDDHDAAVRRSDGAGGRYCRRQDRRAMPEEIAGSAGSGGRAVAMTLRATVLTIFPDMFPGPLGMSLAGKALAAGIWSLETVDIRDFGTGMHRTVDDTPAGGGPGMVMKADVLARAIDARSPADDRPRLLMSPRGRPLTQERVIEPGGGPGRGDRCAAGSRGSTSG